MLLPASTTSAGGADPLREKRLLFNSSISGRPLSVQELSSIDVKNTTSFIKFSGWFSSVGSQAFDGQF